MSITDLIRLPKLSSEVLFQFILMRSCKSVFLLLSLIRRRRWEFFCGWGRRCLWNHWRDRNDRRCWCEYPVQPGEIILDDHVIVENERQNTDHHGEDVPGQHRGDFKDGYISRRLNGLRGIAKELCGINEFKDAQDGRQDGEGDADNSDNCRQCSAGCSDSPDQICDAAGKSHPCDDVDKCGFFLSIVLCVHNFLLKCIVPQNGNFTFLYDSSGE